MAYTNAIDELVREDPSTWDGPKDVRVDEIIKYMRLDRAKSSGKAKKTEVSEEHDENLFQNRLNIVMSGRGVQKKKTFRRF